MGVDRGVEGKEGQMVWEVKARPGVGMERAKGRGLRARRRAIEALKRPHFTPLERSRFAMDTFASF